MVDSTLNYWSNIWLQNPSKIKLYRTTSNIKRNVKPKEKYLVIYPWNKKYVLNFVKMAIVNADIKQAYQNCLCSKLLPCGNF